MTRIQQDIEFVMGVITDKRKKIEYQHHLLQRKKFNPRNLFDLAEKQALEETIVSLKTHIEDLEGEINLLKVREIIDEFGEVEDYDRCEELLSLIKPFGYTFDYYLDSEINNLRKI